MQLAKRHAPATLRNREPLLEILRRLLPDPAELLEIASGSGEHAVFFASQLPYLRIQPTDIDPDALASIDAWVHEAKLDNVHSAQALDTREWPWPMLEADALLCCNMIHIAPPEAAEGLLVGAANVLRDGAPLVVYGPFREGGTHTAESNARFDEDLQRRNPTWGVRDLDTFVARAAELGLVHEETIVMPANNRTLVMRRAARTEAHLRGH